MMTPMQEVYQRMAVTRSTERRAEKMAALWQGEERRIAARRAADSLAEHHARRRAYANQALDRIGHNADGTQKVMVMS